jgi:putative transposase
MDMPTKKRTVAAQAAARGPLPEMPAEMIEQSWCTAADDPIGGSGPVSVVPEGRDRADDECGDEHERRFTGFDDKIIAIHVCGMSVREIQGFIAKTYGTQVWPDFISSVTDEVMAEAVTWQSRPLEQMYPVMFFDAFASRSAPTVALPTKRRIWRAGHSSRRPA